MTGFKNVINGVANEFKKNPELGTGIALLVKDVLVVLDAHARKTDTTMDDVILRGVRALFTIYQLKSPSNFNQ